MHCVYSNDSRDIQYKHVYEGIWGNMDGLLFLGATVCVFSHRLACDDTEYRFINGPCVKNHSNNMDIRKHVEHS